MDTLHKKIDLLLLSITQKFLSELQSDYALQNLSLDACFERDLGIDSLGKLELFQRVEKTLSLRFNEISLLQATTLKALADIIKQTMSKSLNHSIFSSLSFNFTTLRELENFHTLTEIINYYAAKSPERPHLFIQNEQGEKITIRYKEVDEKNLYSMREIIQQIPDLIQDQNNSIIQIETLLLKKIRSIGTAIERIFFNNNVSICIILLF